MKKVLVCILFLFVFGNVLFSQSDTLSPEFQRELDRGSANLDSLQNESQFDFAGTLIETFFYLILIGVMIFGFIWILKKINVKTLQSGENDLIQVLEKRYLDNKKSIYLVQVLDKIIIVAFNDSNIEKLGEMIIDENMDIQQIKFANKLQAEIGSISGKKQDENYMEKIKEKLDKLKNNLNT